MRAGATGWQRDLQKLTDGFSKCDGVNIGSATTQQVCEEYATRRRQFKASRLRWRVSNRQSPKRSLGWVPFKAVGVKVTLRGRIMYEFLERLIKIAIPVIRDFRGVSPRAFDGNGNYTLGVTDQSIFPEIKIDEIKRTLGFDVCIVTSATTDDSGRELLRALGMPFREKSNIPSPSKPGESPEAA